jgi:hypothetical protein
LVEAEEKLKETPVMLKTPSGYVQQSPWLSVSNKQLELLGRCMAELGITPASRARARARAASVRPPETEVPTVIKLIFASPDGTVRDQDGNTVDDDGNAIGVNGDL